MLVYRICGIAEYGLTGYFLPVSCTTDFDLAEYGLAGYSLPARLEAKKSLSRTIKFVKMHRDRPLKEVA